MPASKFLTKKQIICYFSSVCDTLIGAMGHFDFLIYLIYGSAQAKYPELSLKDYQSKCCCSHEEKLQLVGIRVKVTRALNKQETQTTAQMKSEGTWVRDLSLPGDNLMSSWS